MDPTAFPPLHQATIVPRTGRRLRSTFQPADDFSTSRSDISVQRLRPSHPPASPPSTYPTVAAACVPSSDFLLLLDHHLYSGFSTDRRLPHHHCYSASPLLLHHRLQQTYEALIVNLVREIW
ncbi:hypothetical protein L1987_22255 [Smallanthus sonchifolius]|uniref:Uncharacterized protein n=1 Tax=Smallanthus sonchifolius TaxID=185202 RepID=A0ACB9IFU7_9ASTR|nr:hypothetical protein L1987_22255 [Smallanthus sonchifolius]